MQSIKGTLLVLTLCLGAGRIWAKPSWAVFEDVWGDLGDGGKGIIEGLRNATKDGAALGNSVFDNLDTSKGKFLNDLSQLGEDLSNAISESLTTGLKDLSLNLQGNITALKGTVNAEKNLIKKRALLSGLAALEQLGSVTIELESSLSDINKKLAERVNTQLNATLIGLAEWGKAQLERVENGANAAGVAKAQDIINLLVERYTKNLADALVELEVLKSQFEQQLNDKISEFSGYARDLINTMNRCSLLSILHCTSNIEESVENLRGAKSELQALLNKGNDMISSGVYASNALTSLLKQLALDKLKWEKQLDAIINENPRATGSTTTSPGAATTDGSAAESDSSAGSSILGGWVGTLSDGSKILLERIWNATAAGKDILDGLKDAKGNVLEGVAELVDSLSKALSNNLVTGLADLSQNLQGNLTSLEDKIKNETNILKKKALNNGLASLKRLNSTVVELQSALADISLKLNTELNTQIETAITELGEWAEKQLDRVNNATNGAGLIQALDTVKLLSERYTQNLLGTLKQFEVLKAEFDLQLASKIDEYTSYARELINNMNQCLLRPLSAIQCLSITEHLALKLNNAQNELNNLLNMSKQMLEAGSNASKSIESLLKQLAKDKLKIEKELDGIIQRTPRENETTTTSGSTWTTEVGSTTSEGESSTSDNGSTTAEGDSSGTVAADEASTESDSSAGLSSFLGGWVSTLSDGSRVLLEGIWNATATGKDILDGLKDAKGNVIDGVTELVNSLSNALSSAMVTNLADLSQNLQGNITSLEDKIKNETNILRKKALNNGLASLKKLNSTVVELQSALADISLKLNTDLNAQIETAITELGEWAENQLDRVNNATNGAGVRQALDIVKLLTERYTQNLFGALKQFEALKADFDLQLASKIDEYTSYAKELINNMNRCLLRPLSPIQCLSITEQLALKLNNAQNELHNLLNMSKQMLKAGSNASKSIESLLKQLAKDKVKIEKELDRIIEQNRSENETTTTSASTSTTEVGSTTSEGESTSDNGSTTADASSTSTE